MTSSPLRIRSIMNSLQHFRCERHDLHEPSGTQLACHWPENSGTHRLELAVEEHRSIAVKTNQRTIATTHTLGRANHHSIVNLALLDLAARNGFLDGHLDDIANIGIAALGPAQHL